MAKTHQERPHHICDSLSILSHDEPRHKIQKHHNLKCCPIFRYRHKRSAQFNKHLKKARGLRATAEARRVEKKKKEAAALADGLEKLATTDAPAPSTPPVHPAPSDSIAQPPHDPTCLETSPPPDGNVQPPPMNNPNIHYAQEHESLFELPFNEEQGPRRSSDTVPYTLPRTPLSSDYMNLDEGFDGDDDRSLASSPGQDKLGEERSPKLSFLPKELDLDVSWDHAWDLDFSQYTRAGMRMMFENNEPLYDASLAYLLNYDPLLC